MERQSPAYSAERRRHATSEEYGLKGHRGSCLQLLRFSSTRQSGGGSMTRPSSCYGNTDDNEQQE